MRFIIFLIILSWFQHSFSSEIHKKLQIFRDQIIAVQEKAIKPLTKKLSEIQKSLEGSKNNKPLDRLTSERFFSWINEKDPFLGGMSKPKERQDILDLESLNVGLVITLTEDALPQEWFDLTKVQNVHIPIDDFEAPTFQQIDKFLAAIKEQHEKNKNVVVHCLGGKGRTGTMLACWLVQAKGMLPEDAITFVRTKRPKSIENREQEQIIHAYFLRNKAQFCWLDETLGSLAQCDNLDTVKSLEALNVRWLITANNIQDLLKNSKIKLLSFDQSELPSQQDLIQWMSAIVQGEQSGYKVMFFLPGKIQSFVQMIWVAFAKSIFVKDALEMLKRKDPKFICEDKDILIAQGFFNDKKEELDPLYERYLNFSWIHGSENHMLGGMRMPRSIQEIKFLASKNIGSIISLTSNALPASLLSNTRIKNIHIPIKDMTPPTMEQVGTFIRAITDAHKQGKNAVVHCFAGRGRTGTMLACWLLAKTEMTVEQAIKFVRDKRPGSIETEDQENFIQRYFEGSRKKKKK